MMTIFMQAEGFGGGNLVFLVLMIAVMYFFFFRPQMKKQKEEKNFRTDIKKGMRVVMTSGIHGKILEIKDNTVVLECENSRLKFELSAISKDLSKQYLPKEVKEEKKDKKEKYEKEEKK